MICVFSTRKTRTAAGRAMRPRALGSLSASGHKHLRHRASAKMRSGAPRGSVRGSWATRHQLDICVHTCRDMFIYVCTHFAHICMYTTGQLTCGRPTRTGVGRAMRLRALGSLSACGHKHLRHRASAQMRSGAPRGSVRGSWETRHQLDICVHTCRDIFIYLCTFMHICMYKTGQLTSCRPCL